VGKEEREINFRIGFAHAHRLKGKEKGNSVLFKFLLNIISNTNLGSVQCNTRSIQLKQCKTVSTKI
jgi:hypothetical protein